MMPKVHHYDTGLVCYLTRIFGVIDKSPLAFLLLDNVEKTKAVKELKDVL